MQKRWALLRPLLDVIERNEIKPAIDTAKSIADVLGVTVDFLISGEDVIMDKQLLQKIKDIESFSEEEKLKIYELIDMAISFHKTKKAYS